MGQEVFRCRGCRRALTRPVRRLAVLPALEYADEDEVSMAPTVGVGSWAMDPEPRLRAADGAPRGSLGCLVVNPADGLDLEAHPDPYRNSGCCGHDGCDGPNRRCPACHAEVATPSDDCWTHVELRFEPGAVDVLTVP